MQDFAIALAVFIALHVGLSATGLRQRAVHRIGERVYRAVFALASVATLVWVVVTYGPARMSLENTPLYAPPSWAFHATHGLMLLAFLLIVPGLLTPGPTTAGFEGALAKPEPARGVLRITRHPFLWGVAIWGAAHLVSNGDRASVMLFGGLGLMVLLGTRSIDRKSRNRDPEAWAGFAAATSNIPFAAILQGRNRLALGELWLRLGAALLAFVAIGYFHRLIAGVPAFSIGY
ncbi:MAG: NnrU family protein [Alphaproteobacteria bacterium]|jgi:uncharacterized membrane protein|nr:NnrU family protein [Alphaproteobacteria bacterium]